MSINGKNEDPCPVSPVFAPKRPRHASRPLLTMEELLAPEPLISDSDIDPAPAIAPVVVVAHMNQAPTVIQIDAAFVEVAPVEAALVEAARVEADPGEAAPGEAATAEAVPISNAENEGDNPAATDNDDAADTSADENSNDDTG